MSYIKQYTKDLVKLHTKEEATKLMKKCLEYAQSPYHVTYSDEADFNISEHGKYELSKFQTGRRDGNKTRRLKNNVNFYKNVLIELGRLK